MAHEAAMHAVDAQLAAGETAAMDPELAADGLDEMLTVLLHRIVTRDAGAPFGSIGTLHVHCTDVDGEWLVEPGEDGFTVRREHAKGDAALRGPALDLLLRLYNRGDAGEVIGDPGVLERWASTVRF
jgi:predicted lipid carrier protein YhbT